MSREHSHKYRAWDKHKKEMIYDNIEFELRMLAYVRDPNLPAEHFIGYGATAAEHFEMMQSTGLKDKDGKDLDWWGGDIIQKGQIIREITVDWEHGFRFMLGEHQLCKQDGINGTKIGNVHENPERLPPALRP